MSNIPIVSYEQLAHDIWNWTRDYPTIPVFRFPAGGIIISVYRSDLVDCIGPGGIKAVLERKVANAFEQR